MRTLWLAVACIALFTAVPKESAATASQSEGQIPGSLLQARLSPDGQTLAMTVFSFGGTKRVPFLQLLTATATGTRVAPLTAPPYLSWDPTWNPGGNALHFLSDRIGPPQLFQMHPAKGGEAFPITSVTGGLHAFLFSPSGQKLALVAYRHDESKEKKAEMWQNLGREQPVGNAEVLLMGRCARDLWCAPKPTGIYLNVPAPGFHPGPRLLPLAFLVLNGEERLVAASIDAGRRSQVHLLPSKQGGAPVTLTSPDFLVLSLHSAGTSLYVSGATPDGASRLLRVSLTQGPTGAVSIEVVQPPAAAPDGFPLPYQKSGVVTLNWLGHSAGAWQRADSWSVLPTPTGALKLLDAWPYGNGEALLLTVAHQDGSTSIQRLRLQRPVCQVLLEGKLAEIWAGASKRVSAESPLPTWDVRCGPSTRVLVGCDESALLPALATTQLLNDLGLTATLQKSASWGNDGAARAEPTVPPETASWLWLGPSPPPASQAPPTGTQSSCVRSVWAYWPLPGKAAERQHCPMDVDVCLQSRVDWMEMPTLQALKRLALLLKDPHPTLGRATAQ